MANTTIQIKNSGAIGNVPSTLSPGELAINYADGKLFYGNTTSNAVLFDAVTEPAGLNQELQFNNSGVFGSSAKLKFDSSSDELTVNGKISITSSGGDEGGEIFLAKAQTNTTLVTGVTIDVYQNKVRIFEAGGSNRGVYIDLTQANTSADSNLLTGGGGGTVDSVARNIAALAYDAANSAVTSGQANVGAGLITVTSAYQANVGAAALAGQANVGAGLISVTSAYQANVGAGLISTKSAYETNVGIGLIDTRTNYEANVGAGLISYQTTSQANVGAVTVNLNSEILNREANVGASFLLTKNNYEANVGSSILQEQANVGNGLITVTNAYQANVGAGLLNIINSYEANVGNGLITVTNAYQANVGSARIDANTANATLAASILSGRTADNANLGASIISVTNAYEANVGAARIDANTANTTLAASIVSGRNADNANLGASIISVTNAYQANVGAGLLSTKSAYEANVGAGLIGKLSLTGGTISGNVTANSFIANTSVYSPVIYSTGGTTNLTLSDIGIVAINSGGQETKFGAAGIETISVYGGSFGGNKISFNNETNVISNRYDIVKIQTGTGGNTVNEWSFSNNTLIFPDTTIQNTAWTGADVYARNTANLAYTAANSAVTTGQANVGAGLISVTSAYEANVGAAALAGQANVGAGLISVTSAYQANVGAGLITTKSAYEANVGAGLITKLDKTGGTITGDLAVTGNLTITGNTTTINVSSLSVTDTIIQLGVDNFNDILDIGFVGHYANTPNNHTGLVRRALNGIYYLFDNFLTDEPGNIIDFANTRVATLSANLVANVITLRGLDPHDYANTIYSNAQANTGASVISLNNHINNAFNQANLAYNAANSAGGGGGGGDPNAFNQANLAYNAANSAVTTGQANVGAGLISVTSAYQANVGAGLLSISSSITNAYQANVGASIITVSNNITNVFNQANLAYDAANSAVTTGQANVGAGLITVTTAYQVNVGSAIGQGQANVGLARITDVASGQANVGAGLIAYQTTSQANVGAGLLSLSTTLTSAYQANVGAGLIAYQTTSQANVGAGLIAYQTTSQANVGVAVIAGQANVGAGLISAINSGQANVGAGLITITNNYQANVGVAVIAGQANVGAGLIAYQITSQANVGAGLITSAGNINATDDTASATTFYPVIVGGVGTLQTAKATSTRLYFVPSTGTLNATIFNSLSDINSKQNIQTIENSLEKVLQLRGVSFEWIDNKNKAIGVIAQEVEQILPEVVSENENGIKSVSYDSIIGLLIEAIKEQQNQIDELKHIIKGEKE